MTEQQTNRQTYLVFALGPVQGFVSQARRTADSWAGSYLLSFLAGTAALEIKDSGGLLVEPNPTTPMLAAMDPSWTGSRSDDSAVAAIPNTVVAKVEDAAVAGRCGDEAKQAVEKMWEDICDSTATAWTRATGVKDVPVQWPVQTSSLWETYWAWGATSGDAYRHLSMRKALRDFAQVLDHGERCTVCGLRGAMCALQDPGMAPARAELRETWQEWAAAVNGIKGLPRTLIRPDGSERLCAVCTVKRLLPWVDNPVKQFLDKAVDDPGAVTGFPSTSTMATLHYRVELLEKARGGDAGALQATLTTYKGALEYLFAKAISASAFGAWRAFAKSLESLSEPPQSDWLSLDGDLFLFGTSVVNEEGLDDASAREVRKAYRGVLKEARKMGVGDPPIYWALLTMDGDGMGDFLKLVAASGIETTSVSDVLQQFAAEVPRTVAKHNGRAVYAGGDDVVAMFAVKDALPAADELRQDFFSRFNEWFEGLPPDKQLALKPSQGNDGETLAQAADATPRLPTLSGAIVYAHHQAPLSQVFASAHQLLDGHAKKVPGKNAIALRKLQSGAAALTCAASWDGDGGKFADNLTTLVGQLKNGDGVSVGLLNGLRDAAGELAPTGLVKEPTHRIALLARRIEKSRDVEGETSSTELASNLLALADAATPPDSPRLSLDPLLMAVFLRGEGREAR